MNLGLREKLVGAIALLMFVVATFLVLYYPWRFQNTVKTEAHARADGVALALSSALASDTGLDQTSVRARIDMFTRRNPRDDILFIQVMRPDNTVVTAWSRSGFDEDVIAERSGDALDQQVTLRSHDDHVHVSTAILQEVVGHELRFEGTVNMVMSLSHVNDIVVVSRIETAIIGGVLLLVGGALAWLVSRTLIDPILSAASMLEVVSNDLAESARDQEASSVEEAAAVAETRRAMRTLLDSAQKITERTTNVLGNAERTTNGNQQIANRINNLNLLSERIADILGAIMQVADRADLLALNASLEGTRAGDAGKGFALVGAEMRRLAENVIESVSGIRELMNEMRDVSQATVLASEEGTRSSHATRQSAQEIVNLTEEQREATSNVISSMEALGSILELTLSGIQRTSSSAEKLTQLASDLQAVVKPPTPEHLELSILKEEARA
jgi:methyl-accepting chemotaxis protein